jgi:hypothetical protein
VFLHDLAIADSRANLDHVAIGPPGVFVIDSQRWRGYVWVDAAGHARHGGYDLQPVLDTVRWETARLANGLSLPFPCTARAVICLHRASTPADIYAAGVAITTASRVRDLLAAQDAVLGPAQVAVAAEQITRCFPAAT